MKNKKIIILIILILISILTLIGSSYALLTKSFKSEKLSMQVGTLKVDFTEGNAITMNNAIPMTDENGMNTTPYTFTITNSGTIDSYYTISNEEDTNNTLDTTYLKYKLVSNDGYDSGIKRLKDIGTGTYRIVDETSLATGKSVTYKLYLWISSDADNSVQDKIYKSKIVVSSTSNRVYPTVAETLLKGVGDNGAIDTSDSEQTFITGTNPNNYIWYSGKLWRAVSIDTSDNSVKLITQWNMSSVPYNVVGNSTFKDSYIEQWLNDTSVDGFLGNLREKEKFIKMDSVWNATMTTEISKLTKTTMLTNAVGLLNVYEYAMSCKNVTYKNCFLNSDLIWSLINPYNTEKINYVAISSGMNNYYTPSTYGIRPSINLRPHIRITSGDGSSDNPYRLQGDDRKNNSGFLLSTRYSGEYINFGIGDNNLYQIVSHENGSGTKIVSVNPLKENGTYKLISFDNEGSTSYSNSVTIGTFLNNEFLTENLYLSSEQIEMIDDTEWYMGKINGGVNYKLGKYQDIKNNILVSNKTSAKIGLLRIGEISTIQYDGYYSGNTVNYWTLTPRTEANGLKLGYADIDGTINNSVSTNSLGIKPTMNLKSNVVITGGDGTKNNPFTVKLG